MNRLGLLSDKKKELLKQKLGNRSSCNKRSNTIKRYGLRKSAVSFSQQRLWIMNKFESNNVLYNIPTAYRISEKLDIKILSRSLDYLISKHESLRTSFISIDNQLKQCVEGNLEMSIDYEQCCSKGSKIGEKINDVYKEESSFVFDLEKGPLFKVKLLHLNQDESVLYLTFHHIIADAWSIEIFINELLDNYIKLANDQQLDEKDLEIQYADYSVWQNEQIEKGVYDDQLVYWKDKLDHSPEILEFPLDKMMGKERSFEGCEVKKELNTELSLGLKKIAQENEMSLFMVITAAFKIMLNRYTDQEDIIIGTPIANRTRRETHDLIGCFLNTLALRTDLSGDPTFLELLYRLKKTILSAIENQDIPYEKVIEETQKNRTNNNSLFDIMINYVSQTSEGVYDQIGYEPIEFKDSKSKFLFTLYIEEKRDKLKFNIVYQRAYLTAETMNVFMNQFINILEQILNDQTKKVAEFRLVDGDSDKYIPDPTQTIATGPNDTLIELFEEQVKLNLHKVAIKHNEANKTYEDLSQDSARLANFLINKGVRKGEPVALYGERSYKAIVGMLGIFKAGAVLVNIDEELPRGRKELLISGSGVKKILDVNGNFIKADGMDVYLFEESQDKNLDEFIMERDVNGEDPSYIFFTSGSTGTPKGIVGDHKGVSHFLKWQKDTFGISAEDKGAQFTSLSFDVVIRDIFLPLISGATLVIPDQNKKNDLNYLFDWLKSEGITFFHTVPSVLEAWIAENRFQYYLGKLRWIFSAGEPLTEILINKSQGAFLGNYKFVNLYGPSETTLAKSYHVIDNTQEGVQPIGKPISDTQIFIMKGNRVCGVGEIGEIVIRTPYMTKGYLDKANNKDKFIENPFISMSKDMIYRTGDIGRVTSAGLLEIKGRLDDQLKINGVRVHLSEISSVIKQLKYVKNAVVIDGSKVLKTNTTYLIAYVVLENYKRDDELIHIEIKKKIAGLLPLSVIPEMIVEIDKIPLNSNGKVNIKALPTPEIRDEKLSLVKPKDDIEKKLLEIWEDVLNKDSIGVTQNFFEVGGQSLKAFQIISRVKSNFNTDITIQEIFNNPTVEDMAMIIKNSQSSNCQVTIARSSRRI
ncbi:non-ribosomal peptide synthetase [Shouchella lonarensis]|uniref:Amino acid adenylation domain-containing protein n=1 Tax=Shouchella lonarensis TaxID=1464122 RepID=A0A1G6M8L7_9BACI|nr:non-ribosomal peptide synthetase [Shouchella lonarensis]SDC51932.1 amino acid adenylation domain-containing protein [Shouchella lonarensis]